MACPDLFPFLVTYCTHPLGPPGVESSDILVAAKAKSNLSLTLSPADHAAMELNSAVIVWVDILGSTSTGQRPQYCDICTEGLGDHSKLQLKVVMGCENWAMIASELFPKLDHIISPTT